MSSAASTRSSASAIAIRSGSSGCTAASTRARASAIGISSAATTTLSRAEVGDDRHGWYKAPMRPTPPPRRRPARPLADAPVAELLERDEDLAKGWLVALVEQQPLARAQSISAAELARTGPAICAALVRALSSDLELARIAPGGELEGLVSRAGELAGAETAEEVSRAVDALHALLWSAALGAVGEPDTSLVAGLAERLMAVCGLARDAALRRMEVAQRHGLAGALAEAVERARVDGAALSLLLVELEDAARMLAVEPAQSSATMLQRLAATVGGAVRPGDLVISDEEGRVWVIAPGADREQAGELGALLAGTVRDGGSWRAAPLRAIVGVATLDRDGADGPGLVEAAEEACFAAAAAGIEVARDGSPEAPR